MSDEIKCVPFMSEEGAEILDREGYKKLVQFQDQNPMEIYATVTKNVAGLTSEQSQLLMNSIKWAVAYADVKARWDVDYHDINDLSLPEQDYLTFLGNPGMNPLAAKALVLAGISPSEIAGVKANERYERTYQLFDKVAKKTDISAVDAPVIWGAIYVTLYCLAPGDTHPTGGPRLP